ncbi:MAG: Abi-alpha family protein [Desulfitobacteriaceae bacterium]
MDEITEIAKAVQEGSKLGVKAIESTDKAGSFLAKVFKEPIIASIRMLTNEIILIEWKRLLKISDKVATILKERGILDFKVVPPKLALPIIQAASLEDDENLQDLWANLIANAMDPSFNDEIRYGFIDMIKNITGIEAKILNEFYNAILNKLNDNRALFDLPPHYYNTISLDTLSNHIFTKETIFTLFPDMSFDVYAVSANNLMRLQLISPAFLELGRIEELATMESATAYKGIDEITLTPLGVKFIEACIKK